LTTVIEKVSKTQKDIDEEIERIKQYHRNRLVQLAKPQGKLIFYPDGRVYRNDELVAEDPDEWQQEWIKRRMRGSAKSWERWFVDQYFTEDQKKIMKLKDKDIEGINKKWK
jgi:hypothetical protein